MKAFNILTIIAAMLAFAVSVSTLSQGQPKPGLEMKKNDLFKWMDEIGFPSADGSKFFEITLPTPKTCGDRSIILHGSGVET